MELVFIFGLCMKSMEDDKMACFLCCKNSSLDFFLAKDELDLL